MDDSEPVKVSKKKAPSDLTPIVSGLFGQVQFKLLFYVFVIFLLLSNDVFIRSILSNFSGAVEMGSVTTYGTIITGVLLVIFVASADFLMNHNII